MKKNAMLKIAAILMVAVLLTTCAISSTFAKYVTTGKDSDSARVAKWGIDVTVDAKDAFADTYGDKVKAGVANEDLVAPGTKNDSAVTVTIKSKDVVEVKANVNVTPGVDSNNNAKKFVDLSGWMIPGNGTDVFYCPLVFTIKITGLEDKVISQGTNTTADAFEDEICKYIKENFADKLAIEAGKSFDKTLTIGWSWDYGQAEVEGNYENGNDAKDTALGNNAVNNTVAFNVDVVVYQDGANYTTAE